METQPKRAVDRERQWRKVGTSHYRSPKGRFHAVKEDDGWMLLDTGGEFEPEWFATWKIARARVEAVEFPGTSGNVEERGNAAAIELREDEVPTGYGTNVRIQLVRGGETIGDVMVYGPRDGRPATIGMPTGWDDRFVPVAEAEAVATALMLAAHHAARLDRESRP